MVKNIDNFIERLLEPSTTKQRKVLVDRFGLRNGVMATLQHIGDDLGITRERVRQIEAQALKKLRARLVDENGILLNTARTHLANLGGVRRDDLFVADARQLWFNNANARYANEKIRFVFLAAGIPFYHREDDDTRAFWYENDNAKKKFFEYTKQSIQFFKQNSKPILANQKTYLARLNNFASNHFLGISKQFSTNAFGEIGLRSWPEIEPKTVRDKAYLVLRKAAEPLHFETIARSINKYGIDQKPAHIQTVHNELIKDQRFVLVGRGMYALSEHGFMPGTVREVIAKVLKKQGPLAPKDVVVHVSKQRILKENTILLNLQSKKHFKRLGDGRYHVREA